MVDLKKFSLEIARKNSKDLLAELKVSAPKAIERFCKVFNSTPSRIKLANAQHIIAIENGFPSWPAMLQKIRQECFPDIMTACEHLQAGKMILLVDEESREDEGDLCMAAEKVEAKDINFMTKYGRGTVCLSLSDDLCESIGLKRKTHHSDLASAPFTQSIDALDGISSGVSTFDRCWTIKIALSGENAFRKLTSPGHVFPLRARKNGVLERKGHTEGSVDLLRIANCKPAAVVCEIMNEDGSMAKRKDCFAFAEKWNLFLVDMSRIVEYRKQFG